MPEQATDERKLAPMDLERMKDLPDLNARCLVEQFQVGDMVRIVGGHIRYKLCSFNSKDFDEPHSSLRAGCTGCWCPVSKLRRWEK